MSAVAEILTRREAPLLRAMAATLRPREKMLPSKWAERYISLDSKMGAELVGPYKLSFFPWLRAYLDYRYEHPEKKGIIVPKGSQRGITICQLINLAHYCAHSDGNVLYVIGREEEAKYIAGSRFEPMMRQVPGLAERFSLGDDDTRSQTQFSMPYDGGLVNFATAKSAPAMSTVTYPEMILDEFDQGEQYFPKAQGDFFSFALGRQSALRLNMWISVFSHPTLASRGVWKLWEDKSDQGRWVMDCPRCKLPASLYFECIHFTRHNSDGQPVPESAEIRCPNCNGQITDSERRAGMWEAGAPGAKPGASGRLWTPLADDVAVTREYGGFSIPGLADPTKPLSWFANAIASAVTPEQKQTVWNIKGGQGWTSAARPITTVTIESAFRPQTGSAQRGYCVVPGGALGTCMLVGGVDVQAPRENPLLYFTALAFALTGEIYVVRAEKVQGWMALAQVLRTTCVGVTDGSGTEASRRLALRAVAIDDAWEGAQVKNFCRTGVYNAETNARVRLVPVRFDGSRTVNADKPWLLRDDAKRIDPVRPELGAIDMYNLHRHSWVDRALMLLPQKRLHVLWDNQEWLAEMATHMTAQVLTPVRTTHTWGEQKFEWEKVKDRRDDWFMAKTYALAYAAIDGLDRLLINQTTLAETGRPARRPIMAPTLGSGRR